MNRALLLPPFWAAMVSCKLVFAVCGWLPVGARAYGSLVVPPARVFLPPRTAGARAWQRFQRQRSTLVLPAATLRGCCSAGPLSRSRLNLRGRCAVPVREAGRSAGLSEKPPMPCLPVRHVSLVGGALLLRSPYSWPGPSLSVPTGGDRPAGFTFGFRDRRGGAGGAVCVQRRPRAGDCGVGGAV